MAEYLPDWRATENYRYVVGTKGLFGKWSFSVDDVANASFEAINALEETNGWSQEAVEKNDARRRAKQLIWLSSKGISVGPRPIGDLVGRYAFSWAGAAVAAQSNSRMAAWGYPTGKTSIDSYESAGGALYNAMVLTGAVANQRLATQLYSATVPDPSVWRGYFSTLLGVPLGVGTAVRVNNPGGLYQQFDIATIEGLVEEGHLVCCVVMEGLTAPNGSFTQVNVCFKCPSPEGMEGIRYLAYSPSYSSSWLFNTTAGGGWSTVDLMTVRLQGVGAEPMWRYLVPVVAGVNVHDVTPGTNYGASTNLATGVAFREYAPYDDTAFVDYPRFATGGFPGTGVSASMCSVFGQPEFVEGFHVLGETTVTSNEVKIDESTIVLDWVGDRLIETSGAAELSSDQVARLTGVRVRSAVSSRERTVTGPLVSKLSFADDAAEADVDLPNEVMFQADGEQAELTFAQAEKLAVGKKFRSIHQIITKPDVDGFTHLVLTGTYSTPATLAWALYTGATKRDDATVDDALNFIREGGRVSNKVTSASLDQAVEAVFGVPLATFSTIETDPAAIGDFDEAKMFADRAPNVDDLPASKYAGFCLLHFSRSRSQMDGFVAASVAYGRYAHKKLVGGEVIKTDPNVA